ncbi:MAG: manganese efflux pump [Lachnospiraceae bacterium]|nr:manganese efflux pump [Lachnospiraceae bacterium]
MGLLELFVLAVGLAMDAFAVSVCKGLAMKNVSYSKAAVCGIWFGSFQAIMPLIGYFIGNNFASYIVDIDHWIAFGLLVLIGGNMIKESFGEDEDNYDDNLGIKIMFLMAVATSIDALAMGVTFVCVPINILSGVSSDWNTVFGAGVIGIITFVLSCVGVKVGSIFGTKYKSKAEFAGGIVLILIGVKILAEQLM